MRKTSKLVLFGIEDFADIAYEYFTWDSAYEVVAFAVDRAYLETGNGRKFGLPVVAFEDLPDAFPPASHAFFAAVVYADLNRLRERICQRARQQGYQLARYVSSRAFVWPNATLGEHCFIFENNCVQPFAAIGENVVLWCGNQISHHARIGDHCFLSGSVAVGGWANVGDHCFLGLNATLANNTDLGAGSWVSHGAVLSGAIPPASFVSAGSSNIAVLDQARLALALRRASQSRKRHGAPARVEPATDQLDFPHN